VKKRITLFIVLLTVSLMFSGCLVQPENMHTKDLFALNTFLSLRAYGNNAQQALEMAVNRIHEIENKMSITIKDSDVARINANAGLKPIEVHEETFNVIKKALYYSELTNGKFDITIYPIARLWGIGTENARVPDKTQIQGLLPLVNYRNVILDANNMTVFLSNKGMGIDLGGIAKGYAADEVARIIREAGINYAIINMGGSITTVGNRPDKNPWRIGVRNPRAEDGDPEHIAVIESSDTSILSAGDYERFIVDVYKETGVRYHHIFDPFTGFPADTGVIATTVVSRSAVEADALSTAMLVMGVEDGISLIEGIEGVEGLVITDAKEVFVSDGLENYIEFTDPSYSVISYLKQQH
jgi:thiamine biosynthesis lipoprotein